MKRTTSPALYADRNDAARALLGMLEEFRDADPLVLAIPRGGVPIGAIIANGPGGQLDTVLVHKLRASSAPEVAIGAIDECGDCTMAAHNAVLAIGSAEVDREKNLQLQRLRKQRLAYAQIRSRIDRTDRPVIIVDDGLATGLTMIAALKNIRRSHPRQLIAAVPVASPAGRDAVRPYADRLICPLIAKDFYSVGPFYRDFLPVSDEEVMMLLKIAGGGLHPIAA
jgi:putative phosphoribosyl transferase